VRLEFRRLTLPLKRPFETSYGTLRERATLLVRIADGEGPSGFGEAAPLAAYDGVSLEQAEGALEAWQLLLAEAAGPPREPEQHGRQRAWARGLIADCARAAGPPQALAALDVALWDLLAQLRGVPLASLLLAEVGEGVRGAAAERVTVSATVTALDRASAAEQAAQAARAGYPCVKVKVGDGDDAGRVAAVRAAAGPQLALRLDANGAWRVDEAVAAIGALAPAGLELVEEPVHGVRALREVRERVAVRIAADESASEPGALDGAADAVCLKLAACGGISPLLRSAARARAAGCEVYVGSTLEGPANVAAALHAAAALSAAGALPPCGLATLQLFDGFEGVLPVERGEIALPTARGLGDAEGWVGWR
jgi:L-alanine-DL-glutamate epimerase-like enolase superfamily enzyme